MAGKRAKALAGTNEEQKLHDRLRVQRAQIASLRRQLAATATEQTAALEEAQALTHLGSWQWDVATNHIFWSDELYRIYGLKPQEREIGFEEFIGLIHPDDQARVQGIIGAAFASGEAFDFEHRIVLPDNTERILRGMGKVIMGQDGKPIRMLGTSQDITRQKAAELALQQSDQRFRAVTQATHDLVYDLNLREGTIWFNEVLHNYYGYAKQDADNTLEWWTAHIHPDDALDLEIELSRLLYSDEETWHAEYRFQKADGSYVAVRNRAFVLRDDGRPTRIIGSMLDITKQKQLDRAKDEFISLVSHQLRTPLTTIRLLSEMLADGFVGDITPEQREHTAKITGASIRLIKLVSDILNISRAELDRIKIAPVPTDANQLIQTYIDEQLPLAQEKGTVITFKPDPRLEQLALDPIALGQIIQNLLTNAVHYTKPSGGRVTVSFRKRPNGYTLSVRDNGIGIPAAAQGHVFDRFYRAPNTKKVEGEGTGLGLYLVKLITDTFGGNVWFESKLNHGTVFYVQIPLTGMQPKRGSHNLY